MLSLLLDRIGAPGVAPGVSGVGVGGTMTGVHGDRAQDLSSPPWRVCGGLGSYRETRVADMSTQLDAKQAFLDSPQATLRATEGRSWSAPGVAGATVSATPLPAELPADARLVAQRFDASSVTVTSDGAAQLHTGISGAAPLYVDLTSDAAYLCSHIDPLARTRDAPLRPDWDAWAHIIAMGGPLQGRTTFASIRRLQPWARLTVEPGAAPHITEDGWPWLEIEGTDTAGLDPVRDALVEAVSAVAKRGPLTPLLSGGWDSRILTALAARTAGTDLTAWTTSSDTGHVLEELVAAQVAEQLGVDHRIVPPRRDAVAADVEYFARSVDYQTSFHVWLVPLAQRLAGTRGTVLDGLGGGIFVGGAFPDADGERATVASRFERMSRYLGGAKQILHPRVIEQIRERARASFSAVATPLEDHPYGATFTAYLTRTLPGISLAPFGLLAGSAPVLTPFLDDQVVRSALAIRHDKHADGALYAPLLRPIAPRLADLPTASDLTPPQRTHRRRVSSREAAMEFRRLLSAGPVRDLVAPSLLAADIEVWRSRLNNTRFQHLIRGLATLALWWERYGDVLADSSVDALLERVG